MEGRLRPAKPAPEADPPPSLMVLDIKSRCKRPQLKPELASRERSPHDLGVEEPGSLVDRPLASESVTER